MEVDLLQLSDDIDVLVQETHNSSALAMELCPSCTKPAIYGVKQTSTSVQVMDCCLIVPNHNLNQCSTVTNQSEASFEIFFFFFNFNMDLSS